MPSGFVEGCGPEARSTGFRGNPSELQAPPGNRLERLSGDRMGQFSIRINDQYRICFSWSEDGPNDVEIVDYH